MTLALVRASALRLARMPKAWLPLVAWMAFAIVAALLMRSDGTGRGADRLMRGAFSFFVLPLVSYGLVGAVAGAGLRRASRGVVALGAEPRRAALASVVVAVALSAAASGVLAALASAVAHGEHDPPLVRDLLSSLWIGALGGGAYASFFSAGAAIGKGTARGFLLAFDWIAGSGALALVTPRGHVQSLLGGPLCAGISQRASSITLLAMVAAFAGLAILLTRRT